MKQSIKPSLIDLPLSLLSRRLKMPKTSREPKRDLRLMQGESLLKTERERLRSEKEELRRLQSKLRLRLELKSKELPPRKPKRSLPLFRLETMRLPLLPPKQLDRML